MYGNDLNYPLYWPMGWPRTPADKRQEARFAERSVASARDLLILQLRRFLARDIVISSNVVLRMDGLPRSGQRPPADPGVAVYFTLKKGERHVLACDKWTAMEANLWAIAKHIDAMRGISRWGVGSVDQAFMGYVGLPAPRDKQPSGDPADSSWWNILGVERGEDISVIRQAAINLIKEAHPDAGGTNDAFIKVKLAWESCVLERGLPKQWIKLLDNREAPK